MNQAEFERYRKHHRQVSALIWVAILGLSVASGYAVGIAWTFLAGIPIALLMALIGTSAHPRLDRARWIRHFPELAAPEVRWRRTRK